MDEFDRLVSKNHSKLFLTWRNFVDVAPILLAFMVVLLYALWFYLKLEKIYPTSKYKRGTIHVLLLAPLLVIVVLLMVDFLVLSTSIRPGLNSLEGSTTPFSNAKGSLTSTRSGWNSVSLLIPRFFDRPHRDLGHQHFYGSHDFLVHFRISPYLQEKSADLWKWTYANWTWSIRTRSHAIVLTAYLWHCSYPKYRLPRQALPPKLLSRET